MDAELRALIRQVCRANPLWGAPRIHGELSRLGIDVSEATVSKYMVRRPGSPSQTWKTFLENHLGKTIGIDFFTVPTATFRVLFVFIVLSHERRRLLHFNVTAHPTASWTARQLVEACGMAERPKYMVRDRDRIYGEVFSRHASALALTEVPTNIRSPWQNPYAERIIGSIRRDCLDHVITLGERHLTRLFCNCCDYYHRARTHLSLGKDSPFGRHIHVPAEGPIVPLPHLGGLHHEYIRIAA